MHKPNKRHFQKNRDFGFHVVYATPQNPGSIDSSRNLSFMKKKFIAETEQATQLGRIFDETEQATDIFEETEQATCKT